MGCSCVGWKQTARQGAEVLAIFPVGLEVARGFLDKYHPLGARGSLRGARYILGGFEDGQLVFVAVFAAPRSRWVHTPVCLELSRLAFSPFARHSASTFLQKSVRYLRSQGVRGLIVTYALPGTSGLVYLRAGWRPFGRSSGAYRSRRGPNGRSTPDTVGSGRRLMRFIFCLGG
jgi:hypothetical protein